jgi:cbb3-type cytochrome oxidase subunit 3
MLRDVVAGSGLAIFAEVALVLFFAAFVVIVVRVLRTRKEQIEALARIPFDDEER